MGTIKATNIEPIADNGTVTLGSSGDTFSFASGVTGTNYPAFEAQLSANQSATDNVYTKVQFDNEIFDTDNCYDATTNFRFLPTVAGKYFVFASVCGDPQSSSQLEEVRTRIYKNGSSIRSTVVNFSDNDARLINCDIQAIVSMNGSSDYLEIFGRVNDTSGNGLIHSSQNETYFGAYRIGT